MDLQGQTWIPWALAGVLIVVMVLYKLEVRRKSKKRK